MMPEKPVSRARLPFLIAVFVALVTGLAFAGIALHRVAGPGSALGIPTPLPIEPTPTPTVTPAVSPTPTATPLPQPVDSCAQKTFGPALAPKDEPASVHTYAAAPATQIDTGKLYLATITTAKGVISLCLEPALAPTTVNNFVALARNHFYDTLTFHRVVADFVIQGGDPQGTGSGGPGYTFADEPVKAAYAVGAVAMANSGPNTNGSQFFICIGSQCPPLPPKYNLFGVVHSGLDVALKIVQGDVMQTVTVAESK